MVYFRVKGLMTGTKLASDLHDKQPKYVSMSGFQFMPADGLATSVASPSAGMIWHMSVCIGACAFNYIVCLGVSYVCVSLRNQVWAVAYVEQKGVTYLN